MQEILDKLIIYTGNPNWDLPRDICNKLSGVELGIIDYKVFPDKEQWVRFNESIRKKHLVIINENTPADKFFQCLQMIDAAQRADVGEITVCNPYFGWLRQDRQTKGREAINSKIVANCLIGYPHKVRGALSIDNHFEQAASLNDKPWNHIYTAAYFIDWIRNLGKRAVIISPDIGGIGTVRYCANKLGFPMGFVNKIKINDEIKAVEIIRNDQETVAIIIDDIAATFSTAEFTINSLVENGVREIYYMCTHPVLAGNAIENINKLPVIKIVVTNTIAIPEEKKNNCPKLEIIPVHEIFAEAIKNIHIGESVSGLYDPDLLACH